MQSRVLNALAALALMLPVAGHAANFGYSWIDFSLIPQAETDIGDDDFDADGFQLRGSLAVHQNFFALVELEDLGYDQDVDFTRLQIGGGAFWPINNNMDVIGRLGLVRYDVDFGRGRGDDDDTSFFFGARLRAQVAPRVEVEGGVEYSDAEVAAFGDEIFIVGEGRYHFNNQFSVGGFVNLGDDQKKLGVYGRYNF